jgi:hypothetical protein
VSIFGYLCVLVAPGWPGVIIGMFFFSHGVTCPCRRHFLWLAGACRQGSMPWGSVSSPSFAGFRS